MSGSELKAARKKAGKSQVHASRSVGVSQGYVSLLENGVRRVPAQLAKRFVRLYGLAPTALPVEGDYRRLAKRGAQTLAEELAALGYPGFSYLRSRKQQKNPAEVLLFALSQKDLESRLAEALPWVLLHYPELDRQWLAEQARLHNLQNKLGFVVRLAREVAKRHEQQDKPQNSGLQALADLELALDESRLAREDTFCQESLSEAERRWLREVRSPDAEHWNLLTDWTPEAVRYA
jgi:transcriptional regulator with XRE-family HTH domain